MLNIRPELKNAPDVKHEMKALKFAVKDADKGTVEAVFSTFNVKDHDGDITLPDAFENGAKVIISAYGHKSWSGALPVGRGVIRVEKDRAILDGQFFLDQQQAKETFAVIKELADLQEWSYGFDVVKTGELTEEMRQNGVWRVIAKARVYEVSPVLTGAGINTQTLAMKSASEKQVQDAAAATAKAARGEFLHFMQTQERLRKNRLG
jgi:HK97 family phage prohead protease